MPTFKPELTIAVQVSDWLAARDWYRDVLGLEETFVVEEGGWAEFAGPLGVIVVPPTPWTARPTRAWAGRRSHSA